MKLKFTDISDISNLKWKINNNLYFQFYRQINQKFQPKISFAPLAFNKVASQRNHVYTLCNNVHFSTRHMFVF